MVPVSFQCSLYGIVLQTQENLLEHVGLLKAPYWAQLALHFTVMVD